MQNYEIIMNYELLIMNYFVSLHAKCLKMLELKDASLTIDGRQLFSRLSLMAMNGQVTCITGGRGTGKTALLQAMLGLLPLDEGLVSVDGELLTPLSAPVFRRMIAYVPQRREVMISQPDVDTEGLETVWWPHQGRRYQLAPIDDHLNVAPMATKPIIIVDDPEPSMLGTLKKLSDSGHVVVVATGQEEYLNISDKIITLGKNEHHVY